MLLPGVSNPNMSTSILKQVPLVHVIKLLPLLYITHVTSIEETTGCLSGVMPQLHFVAGVLVIVWHWLFDHKSLKSRDTVYPLVLK